MLESNSKLSLSWVYWSYRQPAHVFLEFTAKLLNLRRQFTAADHHPYLFINAKNDKHGGQPLKYNNLVKAFDRACERVDLTPHLAGRSVHGFRDFYKDTLEKTVQTATGNHTGDDAPQKYQSQEDYGNSESATIREALSDVYARMGAE